MRRKNKSFLSTASLNNKPVPRFWSSIMGVIGVSFLVIGATVYTYQKQDKINFPLHFMQSHDEAVNHDMAVLKILNSNSSGHISLARAAAKGLSFLFPEQKKAWEKNANNIKASRIWEGMHYPTDVHDGYELGKKIGEWVMSSYQKKKRPHEQDLNDQS